MQTTEWRADTDLGAGAPGGTAPYDDLARLHAVPVELAVEIGRTSMTLGQALQLGPGSIVELRRLAGEPVDLLAGGRSIARGEVVVVDGEFGLRITEMVVDVADASGDARPAGVAPADPVDGPELAAEVPFVGAPDPNLDGPLDDPQGAGPAADHPE